MTDKVSAEDTLHFIANREIEAIEAYVRAGRRHEYLPEPELQRRWKVAWLLFTADPTFLNRDEMEACEAEYHLRRASPPHDAEVASARMNLMRRTIAATEEILADPDRAARVDEALSRDIARVRNEHRRSRKN
jgi:hypothetical protein